MKILHAMAGDSVGGAETFFVDAVEAIHETGCAQRVITRANNDSKIAKIRHCGIDRIGVLCRAPLLNRRRPLG